MADSINRVLAQPKQRPNLAHLKRVCPQDLAHCEGYVWHLESRIGKGSFGEVYLGWTSDGQTEVAVKVVRKEFFKQDPKVLENLQREIRILKLLRGCEYVVHLFHVQDLKHHVVLVMELCEFDLDHLVKIKPFKEQDIIIFLYQLAQGMKALREQNIVHRDLKPGNILIKRHPITGKMMIKLADFGFARHFKDEGMKPIDMTSLAGTPVFMAPEALRCVFHPGEHYDDKVDIWSIGALLYKVIVGQCGFYAQLQDIPRILKKKGDAIAFERTRSSKINYIDELPSSVDDRLSEPFREKMNELLRATLKLDPAERMTFSEFFVLVDDIIISKIEIVNLLHGTSMKVMIEDELTVDSLIQEVYSDTHVPRQYQVLFSTKSQHFISPQSALSQEQFRTLLDESGGSQGHAKLYLLPVNLVESDSLQPDYSCLAGLSLVIFDEESCVSQIVDHKLSDEMVHMIHKMSTQQKSQLEGLNELCKFVSREITLFGSQGYKQLAEMGHQALARANLAIQWLQQDLSSLPDQNHGQLGTHLQIVNQHKAMIEQLVRELSEFNGSADVSVTTDIKEEELLKAANKLCEESKTLPKLMKQQMYTSCKAVYEDCQKLITKVTSEIKNYLRPLLIRLTQVWRLSQTSHTLQRACSGLDVTLAQVSVDRTTVLRSLSGGIVQASMAQGTPPPLLVTPPGGPAWGAGGPLPGPPPHMSTWGVAPPPSPTAVEAMRQEKAELKSQVERLTAQVNTLKLSASQRQRNSSGGYDDEMQTIRPGQHTLPRSPSDLESTMKPGSMHEDSLRTLDSLSGHLKQFCTTAEKLKPGITASTNQTPRTPTGALYPSLQDRCTVVSMPEQPSTSSSQTIPDNLDALLPKALQLAELLRIHSDNIAKNSTRGLALSANSGLVKIARPSEYQEGDFVIFYQVKPVKSKTAIIYAVMHLERPHPYILLDTSCLSSFNLSQGKGPDLTLGKLTERPRKLRLEDQPSLAEDLACSSGDVFIVRADPSQLKFSAPHTSASSVPPPRPSSSPSRHHTAPSTHPPPASPSTDKKRHSGFLSKFQKPKGGYV